MRCSRISTVSCASTTTRRSPPHTSPTKSSRAATCAARCTACRWRTRTCITAAAWSRPAGRGSCARRRHWEPRRFWSCSTPPAQSSSVCSTWLSSPWVRPATTGTTAIAATPGTASASPAARRPGRASVAARANFAALGSDTGGSVPASGVLRHLGRAAYARLGFRREHPAALPDAGHRRAAHAHARRRGAHPEVIAQRAFPLKSVKGLRIGRPRQLLLRWLRHRDRSRDGRLA